MPSASLTPSNGLLSALRLCRALLDCAKREQDVTAIAELTPTARNRVTVQGLAHLTDLIGVQLPDDLIIMWSLAIPALAIATHFSIHDVPDVIDAYPDVPENRIPISSVPPKPFAAHRYNAHGAAEEIWTISREAIATTEPSICVNTFDDDRGVNLGELLRDQLAAGYREHPYWSEASQRATDERTQPAPAEWIVDLADAPPPPVANQRRVRHATFGEGVVLREEASSNGPKLEVDFGGTVGKKLLLARFVTAAD